MTIPSTTLDFMRRGVVFAYAPDHSIRVSGPRDADLLAALRAQVERRMAALETMPPAGPRGMCDGCGETVPVVLPSGEIHMTCGGGLCALCGLARRKVLERRWSK